MGTSPQTENTARQEWLIKTLYAMRGHFRQRRPNDPEDLTLGQQDAIGVVLCCIDSRILEQVRLKMGAGEYFFSPAAGAAVPPQGEADIQTKIGVGYPTMHFPKAENIVILGHTYCGANKEFYNALIQDVAKHESDKAKWMSPMAPEGLAEALKGAANRGVPEADLLRIVEQMTVLQSLHHLYDYHFDSKHAVQDKVNDGNLFITAAMRDLKKDETKKPPLLVYDPEVHTFRKVEELYAEAFPEKGNQSPSVKPIMEAFKKLPKGPPDVPEVKLLRVQKGAKSKTVSEINIDEIDTGIKLLLDKINSLGVNR